jgi:hypothetical protein
LKAIDAAFSHLERLYGICDAAFRSLLCRLPVETKSGAPPGRGQYRRTLAPPLDLTRGHGRIAGEPGCASGAGRATRGARSAAIGSGSGIRATVSYSHGLSAREASKEEARRRSEALGRLQ